MSNIFNDLFDMEFGHGFDETTSNIFGGHDYSNDTHDIHTEDNIYGGHDIYDHGVYVGHTESNQVGGEDFYDEHNQHQLHTQDNGIGGKYIYSEHGFEGTLDSFHDGDDIFYDANGDIEHIGMGDAGNGSTILQYDDPLAHINSYIMPELLL